MLKYLTIPVILFGILLFTLVYFISQKKQSTNVKPTIDSTYQSSVFTRGHNGQGQLGAGVEGDLQNSPAYIQVPLKNITEISAGLLHSVALNNKGDVYVWGSNTFGQLGVNPEIIFSPKPVKLEGVPAIRHIAASEHHTLALDTEGDVWSWGLNLSGQLGDNSHDNRWQPKKIEGVSDVVQIAAGYRFSVAIKKDGTVWAWGGLCKRPLSPELDTPPLDDYYDPVDNEIHARNEFNNCFNEENVNILSLIPKKIEGIDNASLVSAGFGHILITTKNGQIISWGCNKYGQVGRNKFGKGPGREVPKPIENLRDIIQTAAGFRHSLAIDKLGTVYTWGHNRYGELGTGSTTDKNSPIKITLDKKIISVAAGYDYSIAIAEDNSVYAWGQNIYSQIGGKEKHILKPQTLPENKKAKNIAAGGGHIMLLE